MHGRVPLSIILMFIGACFLGVGITGNAISQTCCFGPQCPAEYLCDAAEPPAEPAFVNLPAITGMVFILSGILGLFTTKRNAH